MSEECFRVSWSGPRVFIREVEVVVDVCDDYRANFRFERFHPVRLRPLFGDDEIEVEDVHGRLIGVVQEEYFRELDAVMGRFSWRSISVSGWTNRELGRQSLVITVRFKILCINSVEENWVRDNLDYWWGLDNDAERYSA